MNFSPDQKKVIEARDAKVLVSAAAGSGKTTVMVERIIEMISSPESNTGIDELVIMTFTNAAAANMREKIRRALDKRIEAQPGSRRLKEQRSLLPRANISTIHSFCMGLIRQHTENLDIEPDFRLTDEGEAKLMQRDALNALFEENYQALYMEEDGNEGEEWESEAPEDPGKDGEASYIKADPEGFRMLVSTFNARTLDMKAADVIEKVYEYAEGRPWPREWIKENIEECIREERGEYFESRWYKDLMEYVRNEAAGQKQLLYKAAEIASSSGGPDKYLPAIEQCIEAASRLEECTSYSGVYSVVNGVKLPAFARKSRSDDWDESKKAAVTGFRDSFKKYFENLKNGLFLLSPEELLISVKGAACLNKIVLQLAGGFMERYASLKKEKNVLDFNDLEHKTLELLYKKEGDRFVPSALADGLSGRIKEIMIDEYQDSSMVQEALISALSACRFGRNNVFMVGDVKQSIYRFRNARPALFTSKLNSYGRSELAPERKIELNSNYRSRPGVLDSVNDVFDSIMSADFGGIEYDGHARLKAEASYPESRDLTTELLLLDTCKEEPVEETAGGYEDGGAVEMTEAQLEYKLVASRINELINPQNGKEAFMVRDAATGCMRRASYRDITLLTRRKSTASGLKEVLLQNRIPAYFQESKGYFEAPEVDMMLKMLGVIDNPMQDIPLAAVMRSVIGGFTNDELALIRAGYAAGLPKGTFTQPGDFYNALLAAAGMDEENHDCGAGPAGGSLKESGEEGPVPAPLREKARLFLKKLSDYRKLADFMPVHVLLGTIYNETGYYSYVTALPGGSVKRKNLDMLLEKAESFGNTNYQGLFNFIRYVEALKKNQADYGEAQAISEHDDIVNISTIHGSKGLEYPIVFIVGAGSDFSKAKPEGFMLVDEYGPGSDYIDAENSIKYPGLKKGFMKLYRSSEEKAEEQRLLYTAMTRAMEKLIITASSKNIADKMNGIWESTAFFGNGGKLPSTIVKGAGSYLQWIAMATAAKREHFEIKYYDINSLKDIAAGRAAEELGDYISAAAAASGAPSETDEAYYRKLKEVFSLGYAHEAETMLKPKVSVSEIKALSADDIDYDDNANYFDALSGPEGEAAYTKGGATRGSAFHRAMELLPFNGGGEHELGALLSDTRFNSKYKDIFDKNAVLTFLKSSLYKRMSEANRRGKLYREQHFMAGFPADTLIKGQESGGLQLLQGVIDAYFEEDGGLTIVDYKTDRLGKPESFLDRYEVQLGLYKRALRQLTGMRVRKCVIYSTFLSREIVL